MILKIVESGMKYETNHSLMELQYPGYVTIGELSVSQALFDALLPEIKQSMKAYGKR